ncbi:MAG: hypothetical protein HQL53_06830 [Magnetococcales bacterium]|nr:hypothetical protein [Magnetococcales bacterium]
MNNSRSRTLWMRYTPLLAVFWIILAGGAYAATQFGDFGRGGELEPEDRTSGSTFSGSGHQSGKIPLKSGSDFSTQSERPEEYEPDDHAGSGGLSGSGGQASGDLPGLEAP